MTNIYNSNYIPPEPQEPLRTPPPNNNSQLDQIFDYIYSKPEKSHHDNSFKNTSLHDSPKRLKALNLVNAYKSPNTHSQQNYYIAPPNDKSYHNLPPKQNLIDVYQVDSAHSQRSEESNQKMVEYEYEDIPLREITDQKMFKYEHEDIPLREITESLQATQLDQNDNNNNSSSQNSAHADINSRARDQFPEQNEHVNNQNQKLLNFHLHEIKNVENHEHNIQSTETNFLKHQQNQNSNPRKNHKNNTAKIFQYQHEQSNIISSQKYPSAKNVNLESPKRKSTTDSEDDYALFEKAQARIDKLHGGLKPAYNFSVEPMDAAAPTSQPLHSNFRASSNLQKTRTKSGGSNNKITTSQSETFQNKTNIYSQTSSQQKNLNIQTLNKQPDFSKPVPIVKANSSSFNPMHRQHLYNPVIQSFLPKSNIPEKVVYKKEKEADFKHDQEKKAILTEEERFEYLKNRKEKFTNKFSMWEQKARHEEKEMYKEELARQHRLIAKNNLQQQKIINAQKKQIEIQNQQLQQTNLQTTPSFVYDLQQVYPPVHENNTSQPSNHSSSQNLQIPASQKQPNTSNSTGISSLPFPTNSQTNKTPKTNGTRKMKIIIQQKPNLENGFGFTLKIAPGRVILVDHITKNGSADRCGLKLNDEVDLLNDHPVNMFSMRELNDVINNAIYNGNISLMISRQQNNSGGSGNSDSGLSPTHKTIDTTSYGFVYKPTQPQAAPTKPNQQKSESVSGNPFKKSNNTSDDFNKNRHISNESSNYGSKILTDSIHEPIPVHNHQTRSTSSKNTGSPGDDNQNWYREMGLEEDSPRPQAQFIQASQKPATNYIIQNSFHEPIQYKLSSNVGILSTSNSHDNYSNHSSNSKQGVVKNPTNGRQQKHSGSKSNTSNELAREEYELKMRMRIREAEEEHARNIHLDNEYQTSMIQRMELEAKQAEQKALQNRQRYEQQMQKIDDQLKEEEERLRQLRENRQIRNNSQNRNKNKHIPITYHNNYNSDYAVIYPKNYNTNNNNNHSIEVNGMGKIKYAEPSPNSSSENSNEQNLPPNGYHSQHHHRQQQHRNQNSQKSQNFSKKTPTEPFKPSFSSRQNQIQAINQFSPIDSIKTNPTSQKQAHNSGMTQTSIQTDQTDPNYQPRFYYENREYPSKNINDHWLVREADKKFERDFSSQLQNSKNFTLEEYETIMQNASQNRENSLNLGYKGSVEDILNDPDLQATLL